MIIIIGYAALMSAIFVIDRLTKIWATQACEPGFAVTSFLSCSLTYNRGVAWSLGDSEHPFIFHAVSLGVMVLTMVLALHAYRRAKKGFMIWAECAIIAGSLSNIYDRYTVGGVIDFIEFSYGILKFPIFNGADVAIVVGVMIMILQEYREAV